jgi:hypothetical protein
LATATTSDGTSSRNANVALSLGWSFEGNQWCAPSGSLNVIAPSSTVTQPVSVGSPGVCPLVGVPAYRTRTTNGAPFAIGVFVRISRSVRVRLNVAGRPSTTTRDTRKPARSRAKVVSCSVAVARIVTSPASRSVPGVNRIPMS